MGLRRPLPVIVGLFAVPVLPGMRMLVAVAVAVAMIVVMRV